VAEPFDLHRAELGSAEVPLFRRPFIRKAHSADFAGLQKSGTRSFRLLA
jgi:hypothetical protein